MAAITSENQRTTAAIWPTYFTLIVGVVFGGSMVFMTPPFNVPDEQGHWYRSYQCSLGRLIPTRQGDEIGSELPTSLRALYVATAAPALTDAELQISVEKIRDAMKIKLHRDDTEFRPFSAVARYGPLPYLPAALAIRFGRHSGLALGPLQLFYLGRVATLVAYLVLVVTAVWLMPVHRWTLAMLALMPMSIFLAASLSPDALTIALSLLGIAMILRMALRPEKIGRGSLWSLGTILLLVGLSKPSYGALSMLALVLRKEKFSDPGKAWWIRGLLVGLPLAAGAAWVLSLTGLDVPVRTGVDMKAQVLWILGHPGTFMEIVISKLASWHLYSGAIASLGWGAIFLPPAIYAIYWSGLLTSAVLDGGDEELSLPPWIRAASVAVYFLILVIISILTFLTWQTVGETELHGVQSRYLLPILPLLLLSLRGPGRWAGNRYCRLFVPAMAIVVVLIGVAATWQTMIAHFYWTSGV
jgi:uncharacterized membrane protein